jgi:hypothetical protein
MGNILPDPRKKPGFVLMNVRPLKIFPSLILLLKGYQKLKPVRIHFGENFFPPKRIAFNLLQRLPI